MWWLGKRSDGRVHLGLVACRERTTHPSSGMTASSTMARWPWSLRTESTSSSPCLRQPLGRADRHYRGTGLCGRPRQRLPAPQLPRPEPGAERSLSNGPLSLGARQMPNFAKPPKPCRSKGSRPILKAAAGRTNRGRSQQLEAEIITLVRKSRTRENDTRGHARHPSPCAGQRGTVPSPCRRLDGTVLQWPDRESVDMPRRCETGQVTAFSDGGRGRRPAAARSDRILKRASATRGWCSTGAMRCSADGHPPMSAHASLVEVRDNPRKCEPCCPASRAARTTSIFEGSPRLRAVSHLSRRGSIRAPADEPSAQWRLLQ